MSEGSTAAASAVGELPEGQRKLLFWACFAALVATSFCFVTRSMLIGTWGTEFGWTETQKGQILGVGLWPFSISIILFSLVVDRIGYGTAMAFAFICHVLFAVVTIMAPTMGSAQSVYMAFYFGSLLGALAAGTVEAVINPVVATLFPREKVKWLSILHAGWPGGLVLGGILNIGLGDASWKVKIGLILIPTIVYGVFMLGRKFPIHERVAAGVSYRDMLREFGVISALIVSFLVFKEIGRVFSFPEAVTWTLIIVATLAFGVATGFAPGRGLFIILVLIMMPLATTELGTDTWVTDLMGPEMEKLGVQAGWILVYTSLIMMILRFLAGSIVHRLSPLGLLSIAAALAMIGLFFLSSAVGAAILVAATIYGVGKTFFWPAMLGVVSEQFPRGGALTINGVSGIGMLAVGTVGAVFLGYIQDTSVNGKLKAENAAIHQQVADQKQWVFGQYEAVDPAKVEALPNQADKDEVKKLSDEGKKEALKAVAIFPAIMLVAYLLLMGYFKSKGGYKPVLLTES
ncbi:MAG: MFS transporter [Chthonomonadales bacterium]|nr:MFS transporter [Chthonomonadales bacterium]